MEFEFPRGMNILLSNVSVGLNDARLLLERYHYVVSTVPHDVQQIHKRLFDPSYRFDMLVVGELQIQGDLPSLIRSAHRLSEIPVIVIVDSHDEARAMLGDGARFCLIRPLCNCESWLSHIWQFSYKHRKLPPKTKSIPWTAEGTEDDEELVAYLNPSL